jgi:HD-like signal output (HDOD) protein
MASRLVWVLAAVAIVAAVSLSALIRSFRRRGDRTPDPERLRAQAASVVQPASPNTPPTAEALSSEEIFARLHELELGQFPRKPAVSPEHEAIAARTVAALDEAATQQRYSPRRPNMLPRLMNAASDERVSRRELASIIARDPSLVGSLLKIANSSFYRVSPEPVESVDRAVVLLGTNGIRSLITTALMQPIFRLAGVAFPRFPEIAWEHTFRSASAAVPYTVVVEKSDPFAAELLALVMGLASIVVFRVALDQYATDERLRPEPGVIASLLDSQSAKVARRIGASWELSERTLAAFDDVPPPEATSGQTAPAEHPVALGRALRFGRLAGALAVLHSNHLIDAETAKASLAGHPMPPVQLERMWERLTAASAS